MPVTHGVAGSSPVRTARTKFRICTWCGSSAWLEYMPVTHGVAGSSPVRTAKRVPHGTLFCFISTFAQNKITTNIFFKPRNKKKQQFFCQFNKLAYLCTRISESKYFALRLYVCGNSSVGRAQPCQGWGREFESRFPLKNFPKPRWRNGRRARFRCECFTTCRFESCSGHELRGKDSANITGEVAELVDALL